MGRYCEVLPKNLKLKILIKKMLPSIPQWIKPIPKCIYLFFYFILSTV